MIQIGTLPTPVELQMLKEIFQEHGINLYHVHREAGDFLTQYMGSSMYGIDIFVNEEDEEEGRNLFEIYFNAADIDIIYDYEGQTELEIDDEALDDPEDEDDL